MTDETTTEQLVEIEGQAAQYTPPEGWRVLRFGEQLLPGDVWVNEDGTERRSNILQWDAAAVSGGRCIRRIEPQPEPKPVQVREGRWRTRHGDIKNIRPCEPLKGAYYVWPWTDGFMTFQDNGRHLAAVSDNDLVEYLGPIEPDKTQELETKTQELPEYTPPEGWRALHVGEELRQGDVRVDDSGACSAVLVTVNGVVPHGRRYIRPIEPQPQPEPQLVQIREGRWRTRGGEIRNVTPRPEGDGRKDLFPWWDAAYGGTWTSGGRYYFGEESPLDLDEYLGPIEPQTEPQPEPVQVPESNEQIRLLKECNARQAELIADLKYERSGAMESREVLSREKRKLTEQIEELRSEVAYVQNLLGESRQRVTQLEELVSSLRTINEGAEKAVSGAGVVNDSLRLQLAAVKAELASVAADRQRLQIELDAAQQVPADSPELRQLRADLEQVTRERDEYRYAHDVLVKDANTVHERTKAMTVEAIAEWLEPIRAVDNPNLANETLQHLPQIMRSLVGLDTPEDVD